MKIFTNKRLFKKILIVIIAIMLFSAVVPPKVAYAEKSGEEMASTVGGALLSPVAYLMIGLGDVIMNVIHDAIYDMDTSLLVVTKNSDVWGILLTILAGVAAVIVVGLLSWGAAVAGAALLKVAGIGLGSIVVASLTGGVVAGALTYMAWFGDNIVFPMYQVSPEEIFKNEVELLDINFFDPIEKTERYLKKSSTTTGYHNFNKKDMVDTYKAQKPWIEQDINSIGFVYDKAWEVIDVGPSVGENYWYDEFKYSGLNTSGIDRPLQDYYNDVAKDPTMKIQLDSLLEEMSIKKSDITNDNKINITVGLTTQHGSDSFSFLVNDFENNIKYNYFGYQSFRASIKNCDNEEVGYYYVEIMYRDVREAKEEEIEGQVSRIMNIDVSEPDVEEGVKKVSLGAQLQETVTKWYYTIRNFVLVIMMIILLYIGIRILVSSISAEKAKYKNMLTDWLVAICLVFVMHYIMVFAINLVEGITNICATVVNGKEEYANIYEVDDTLYDKLKPELSNLGIKIEDLLLKEKSENGKKLIVWNSKNLLGMARIKAALSGETKNITYIGYGLIFLVLVFYTLYFIFTYMKRALYITFFTIIAPFVAMTYPIDKLHDGKAQAFNMWFKEYIFNLMIQPVHLLLYTILISSAFELATTNMIYSLVAIGFLMPAEKFLRKMFGFDKAQTPGFLGGAAGAGLMMGLANKVFHKRPSKGQHMINDVDKSSKDDKINMKDDSFVDPFLLAEASSDKQSINMSNVLSNQEKERQKQKELAEMEKARLQSQTPKFGQIDLNKAKNSQGIGFNKSSNVDKQFEDQRKKLDDAKKRQQKTGFLRRQGRGIKAASKAYVRQKLTRLGKNMASGKPIRDLAKLGGGLFVGSTGAFLGTALGISSGELKNVGGYATTLGVGGYALGARDMKSHPDIEMAYEEYQRAQYGSEEEYRKHLLEEQRKEVSRNDKKLEELRTYLKLNDQEEAKDYMEEYGECIDAGITDMQDFATIIKAVEEEQWSRERAITAAKFYKKAGGKPKNMGKRDRENIEFQYKNIVKANGITDEQEVDKTVKTMLKTLDKYGKIKDDLTQV